MARKVVARLVTNAELRGEFKPATFTIDSGLSDLEAAQVELGAAYAKIKLRTLLDNTEWALELQDQILEDRNPFEPKNPYGFFVIWPITAEDILDELID